MKFDLSKYSTKFKYYLGCDEVGRGPLAGPVVSCSVMTDEILSIDNLKKSLKNLAKIGVGDSKKLSSKKRLNIISKLSVNLKSIGQSKIYHIEVNNISYSFSISIISNILIDQVNILNASLLSMSKTIEHVVEKIDKDKVYALIDGNKLPKKLSVNSEFIIKGDQKSLLIGVASIIAKEWRDQYMNKMSLIYPDYGFERHSGYPTKFHKEAVQTNGITPIHRKTFKGCKE